MFEGGSDRFEVVLGADASELSRILREVPRLLERTAADLTRITQRIDLLPVTQVRQQSAAAAQALSAGLANGLSEGVRAGTRRAAEQLRGVDGRLLASALDRAIPPVPMTVRPVVDRAALAAIPRSVADALATVQPVRVGPARDSRGRFLGGGSALPGAEEGAAAGRASGQAFARGFSESAQGIVTAFEPSGAIGRTLALGAATYGVRALLGDVRELTQAQFALTGASKQTGVALGTIQGTAFAARDEFRLSETTANQLSVAMTKMAARAGDVGRASGGLRAFLDLGASQGLSAAQTLEQINLTLLGQDEGLNRLGLANPQQIYEQWAAAAGTTAAKMTDAQKALAVLDAVTAAGGRVRGEFARWLETTPGQLDQLGTEADALAKSAAGALTPALTGVIGGLRETVQFAGEHGPLVTGIVAATTATYALSKAVGVLETAAAGGGIARFARLLASPGAAVIAAAAGAAGIVAYGAAKEDERANAPAAAAAQAAQAAGAKDLVRYLNDARAAQSRLNAEITAADPAKVDIDQREGVNARRAQLTRELQFVNELVTAYEKRNAAAVPTTAPPPTVVTTADASAAKKAFQALENDTQGVVRILDSLTEAETRAGVGVARGVEIYDRLGASLARQRDQFSETSGKLKDYRDQIVATSQAVALLRSPEATANLTAGVLARIPQIALPAAALDPFRLAPNAPQFRASAANPIGAAPQISTFQRGLTVASSTLRTLRDASDVAGDALRDAPNAVRDFLSGLTRGLGSLETVVDAVRRPRDLVGRTASGGVDALATVGNVAGAAGAALQVASLVGQVFGESAGERERRQLLRQNNDRLAELRDEISGYLRSATGIAAAQRALTPGLGALNGQGVNALAAVQALSATKPVDQLKLNGQSVDQYLRSQIGLSFGQLNTLAGQQGITLLDSKGRIVAGALDQLREALGLTAERLTRFGVTLDDQRGRADLRDQLFNPTTAGTPGATITRELALLQRLAPTLGGQFAGLSGDTAAGREAIRAGLQNLFTRIDTNALQLADLGQLANLDELVSIIRSTNDALGQMGDAANSVTAALLNVPTGFKVALARFDAQDAYGAAFPSAAVPPLAFPALPNGGAPAGRAPSATPTDAGGFVHTGDVYVTAAAGETSDEAYDRWVRRKRRVAQLAGRNPNRWPEVAGLDA